MGKTQPRTETRRQFLGQSAGATAGFASWLALGQAPAFAQKRELTFLSWNHFVPAAADELPRQAEIFGKQAGATVRVDTIASLQLPAKFRRSGPVPQRSRPADQWRGRHLPLREAAREYGESDRRAGEEVRRLVSVRQGGLRNRVGVEGGALVLDLVPGHLQHGPLQEGRARDPEDVPELLHYAKILKKQGNPAGMAISHCADANTTFASVLWSYGGKMLETDGKTRAINSDQTAQVIEWYKEL
jgi:hypothetical protein